jgi:hypothetical protein
LAITTAQYRNHVLLALKSTVQAEPRLFLALLPGLIDYARTGADPREAMEMLLTWSWQHIRGGIFDGHAFKHLLVQHGVPSQFAQDVIERAEP